jgi:hypothetical protein
MKVTATALANGSKSIIDRMIEQSKPVEVQGNGKTIAVIRQTVGVDRKEFLRLMRK